MAKVVGLIRLAKLVALCVQSWLLFCVFPEIDEKPERPSSGCVVGGKKLLHTSQALRQVTPQSYAHLLLIVLLSKLLHLNLLKDFKMLEFHHSRTHQLV